MYYFIVAQIITIVTFATTIIGGIMILFNFYFRTYDCPCHCHVHNEGMGITAETEGKAREEFWAMGITAETEGKAREEFWAGKPDCASDIQVEVAPDWLQPASNLQASIRKFEAWRVDAQKGAE